MFRIFILEKDQNWADLLSEALKKTYEIKFCCDEKDLFEELKSIQYDLLILDLEMDEEDPFDLLRWVKMTLPHPPVIILSDKEKAELVVAAIKQGAYDFIAKPFSVPKIQLAVRQALENISLRKEIDYLRREQDIVYNFDKIIAFSPVMKDVVKILKKFSKTDATILITGETGTGKSFLSGTVHFNSHRKAKPFIKISCSNIPETLLESELFGHEKGAFTGADRMRIGRFEQAHGGTLFLDEIGELTPLLQAKLLRVLEDRSFERVGGNQTIHSDVRVIAATNRNLEDLISKGTFREDLYYRINILSVLLPPLRERRQCIEPLSYWLLENTCRSLKKTIAGFSPEVSQWIRDYSWPGNIRQLSNTIERAVILEESSIIRKESVSMLEPVEPVETLIKSVSSESLAASEKELLLNALQESLWIQKDAAKLLGITPRTLNYKIKKHNITHPRWRKNR